MTAIARRIARIDGTAVAFVALVAGVGIGGPVALIAALCDWAAR